MNDQPQAITLKTSRQSFAALAWGPAEAPILLALHGWLDNAASFSRLAPLLPQWRIIAVDLAGHGHSPHRGEGAEYTLWSHIPDVLAIADTLGQQQLHLLGHSMGAIIAVAMAALVPGRVGSLTLIDGLMPLTCPPTAAVAQLKKAVNWHSRPQRRGKACFPSVELAVKARRMSGGEISQEAAEQLVRRGLKQQGEGWVWRSDSRLLAPSALRLGPEQAAELVQAIAVPTLLVAAAGGSVAQQVTKLVERPQTVTVKRVEGRHHLHLEATAPTVAQAIVPHLAAVTGDSAHTGCVH